MSTDPDRLPDDVLAALRQGETIEAIKRLRAATGLGLKEAKDIIDAHLHGQPLSFPAPAAPVDATEPVMAAIRRGNKIEAIKQLREQTGLGLKEAKDAVDALAAALPATAPAGHRPAIERADSSRGLSWLVGLLLLAAAIYTVLHYFS
ncbi:ribosomal protein L7/L12 [Arenimonas oryziterrae]|uniref:Large ribosomal subunit protein bL12 C-terminal domain-containing protein n=1 Tax=Arenimonas oryziterrae DSM 21050 = YC6267 TaxID=1121015 RepID=A0A091AUI1_9GAMM|nr:hypothetical protein N789_10945 [Arenimonas oryziterrae DSM 21050 = YC6267]